MADNQVAGAASRAASAAPFDAVLFASYGTSREEARAASIAPLAAALKQGLTAERERAWAAWAASGDASVGAAERTGGVDVAAPAPAPLLFAEAYTSAKARRVLECRGTPVPDVSQALHELARAGARRVLVQPGHLVYGSAFELVERAVAACRFLFARLELARPLLASDADLAAVAAALDERYPRRAGEAVVLVEHGVDSAYAHAGSIAAALTLHLQLRGRDDMLVGSMHGFPGKAEVLGLLAARRAAGACGRGADSMRVRLAPLMLTAAAHASRDIAGDRPGTWRRALEDAGYPVEAELVGLGSLPAVRAIYVEHAIRAWREGCAGESSATPTVTAAATGASAVPTAGGPVSASTAVPTAAVPAPAPTSGRSATHLRFPLFQDLTGASCLVVGLGTVGLRRACTLARFGARVLAIDPAPRAEDVREAQAAGVDVRRRACEATLAGAEAVVAGMRFVVAATLDRAVNTALAAACDRAQIPVSVADSAQESTAFFPAIAESEHLVAGIVSTGHDHALTAQAAASVREALAQVEARVSDDA